MTDSDNRQKRRELAAKIQEFRKKETEELTTLDDLCD